MKLKKSLLSSLSLFLFCLGMTVGSLFCAVSAYSFPVHSTWLVCLLAFSLLLWVLCLTLPGKKFSIPLVSVLHLLFFIFERQEVVSGAKAVLNELFSHWSVCYSWCPSIHFLTHGGSTAITVFFLLVGVTCGLWAALSLCVFDSAMAAVISVVPCFAVSITVVNYSPATVWVICMFAFVLLSVLTQAVRSSSHTAGARLSLLLLLPMLLLSLGLALFLPKENYRRTEFPNTILKLLSGQSFSEYLGKVSSGTSGNVVANPDAGGPDYRIETIYETHTVAFRSLGKLEQSDSTVLTVTAPFSKTIYLRGVSMGSYDPSVGWNAADISHIFPFDPLFRTDLAQLALQGTDAASLSSVSVETYAPHDVFYIPYYASGEAFGALQGDSYLSNASGTQDYTFSGVLPSDSIPDGATGSDLPASYESYVHSTYTALPDATKSRIRDLAAKFSIGSGTVDEIAASVASYYRTNGTYTLDPPLMPEGDDFAVWFTESSLQGYCVHFATAATVMLRALDVPARFVTGYAARTQDGKPARFTGKNAHAWVEYYRDGFGWVLLEVTPANGVPDHDTEQTPTAATESTPAAPTEEPTVPAGQSVQEPRVTQRWSSWYLLLLFPFALLLLFLRRRIVLRRRALRQASVNNNRRGEMIWSRILRLQKHTGLAPEPAMEQIAMQAKFSASATESAALADLRNYEKRYRMQAYEAVGFFRRLWFRWILIL